MFVFSHIIASHMTAIQLDLSRFSVSCHIKTILCEFQSILNFCEFQPILFLCKFQSILIVREFQITVQLKLHLECDMG